MRSVLGAEEAQYVRPTNDSDLIRRIETQNHVSVGGVVVLCVSLFVLFSFRLGSLHMFFFSVSVLIGW
jgi:hypothetical protein